MHKQKIIVACLFLFALSAAVRFIVWQNNKIEMAGVQLVVSGTYKQDARPLFLGDFYKFAAGDDPPSNANVLGHPPGYPIFIAANWAIFGENNSFLIVQILLNSFAPLLIFGIALRLFEWRTAAIAGALTALAPQFAYHSALVLPDELSVIPILGALYVFLLARENGRMVNAIGVGVLLGISCWLRANAMLLPVFFSIAVFFVLPRSVRSRFTVVLLAAFLATIAPITIRNWVIFDSFVPLSLASGTTLLEGLGDYDTNGQRGMPTLDEDVMRMDVTRSGRQDYYGYLYSPDGVQRERARIKDGLAVIATDPLWYARAVGHRAITSFRMERVPAIAGDRDERAATDPVLYYLNVPLKMVQKAFVTVIVAPLFLLGILVLGWVRRAKLELVILAIIPLYFALVQSLLHTEYRYVLATPHIMMIVCAIAISWIIGKVGGQTSRG